MPTMPTAPGYRKLPGRELKLFLSSATKQANMQAAALSLPLLMVSGLGIVVVAASILGDFGLTPFGTWALRLLGVILIGIGLLAA